jgi:hypothetical protein
VFVDKVDEAFLLKRKIMQQERGRLEFQVQKETAEAEKQTRQSLEAAIRAKVREELEAQYGLAKESHGMFRGKAGLLRAIGLVVLIAGAFIGGQKLSMGHMPWADKAVQNNAGIDTSASSVDKMLNSGLGPSAPASQSVASSATGDPDIDNDPMLQAIGGNRIGAKGISMEQALSAATVLAKSVGNTTAERAMAGGQNGSGTSAPSVVGASADGAGANGSARETSPGKLSDVPSRIKLTMAAEFAVALAECGQIQRAQRVLSAIKNKPALATDQQTLTAVNVAGLEIQAWALQSQAEGKSRRAADVIRSQSELIASPSDRAQAMNRVAVILSQQSQLLPTVPQAFLTLSVASLKNIPDPKQKGALVGEWLVSMGTVLLAEATSNASAGRWAKARGTAMTMDALMEQARDDQAQIKLNALYFRLQQVLGNGDKASQSLSLALTLAKKYPNFTDRAASLRSIAQLSGNTSLEQVQSAVNSLVTQIEPTVGPDKAQAMVQLAILQAEVGMQEQSERLSQRAESAVGLTAMELLEIKSDLIVRTDLALAKSWHKSGSYAKSEVLMQRIGDYLF